MAADLGIIGMGAMGGRMALLFASKGYKVAIFNRTPQKSAQVVKDSRKDREVDETLIERYTDLRGFVKGLKPNPRKVFINVSHGSPVDQLLDQLLQLDLLEAGDIVADLGNEWYKETERRIDRLAKHGIEFLGIGVSGGYQSARHGPSMTAGGGTSRAAGYEKLRPLLESVAPPAQPLPGADVKSPCVAYFGPGGAGHYVKMIHNGIEQGMMGILAEAYGIMRDLLGLSHSEMAVEFGKWLQTPELKRNYLIEISVDIVQKRDEERQNNGYLLDKLSDRVLQDTDGSEGTGVWTVKEMAERHVPCPTIAASHLLRILSTNLESRMVVSAGLLSSERAALAPQANPVVQHFLPNAVYLGMLCSYLQGMDLLTRTAKEEKWWHPGFPLNALFSWKEGCIIRSEHILDLLQQVFPIMDRRSLAASDSEENLAKPSLVSNETITKEIAAHLEALRVCVLAGISHQLPVPTLAATLEYLDSMRKVGLPTSMMQAQLDCFGWHRYQRAHEDDCQAEASHHVEWMPF